MAKSTPAVTARRASGQARQERTAASAGGKSSRDEHATRSTTAAANTAPRTTIARVRFLSFPPRRSASAASSVRLAGSPSFADESSLRRAPRMPAATRLLRELLQVRRDGAEGGEVTLRRSPTGAGGFTLPGPGLYLVLLAQGFDPGPQAPARECVATSTTRRARSSSLAASFSRRSRRCPELVHPPRGLLHVGFELWQPGREGRKLGRVLVILAGLRLVVRDLLLVEGEFRFQSAHFIADRGERLAYLPDPHGGLEPAGVGGLEPPALALVEIERTPGTPGSRSRRGWR